VEGDWPDNFNSLHVTDGGWSEKFVDSCAEPPIPHLFEPAKSKRTTTFDHRCSVVLRLRVTTPP
jgi:hypothetical protein